MKTYITANAALFLMLKTTHEAWRGGYNEDGSEWWFAARVEESKGVNPQFKILRQEIFTVRDGEIAETGIEAPEPFLNCGCSVVDDDRVLEAHEIAEIIDMGEIDYNEIAGIVKQKSK